MASDSSSLIIEKRSERVFSLNGGEPYVKVCNFIKPCGVSNNNNNEKVISPAPVLPKPTSNSKLEALYPKVKFKGRHSSPDEKWKTWILSLHSKHHLTWKQAGIEKPILSSLYKIVKQNDVILKVADRWCADTNTFIFPCGESTLTSEDMLVLGGFSVLGHSVSTARILDDDDVLLMIRENALIKALKTLIRTSGKRYCSNYTWMDNFMGTGKELEHEAFLVFWLLRFVFPKDAIRRDIFPIAIRLSKGHRLALGPAVLASIYRDLRQLKHYILSNKNGYRSNSKPLYLWAPLQLVQLWVWERFPTLSPKPCSIKPSEPRVARWVFIHKLKVKQAGLSINNVGGEFSWRPYTAVVSNWQPPDFYREICCNLSDNSEIESFAKCIRVSELVGFDCTEAYNPHRVAMQFGYDQDVPRLISGDVCINYDRPIKEKELYVPGILEVPDVTQRYFDWWMGKEIVLNKKDEMNIFVPRKKRTIRTFPRGRNLKKVAEDHFTEDKDRLTIPKFLQTFNKNNTIGNASNIPSPPLTAENDIHIKTTLMVKVTEMNTQLPEFAREEMEKNMEDRNLSNVQSFIGESEKAKEVGVDINPSSTMKNTEKSTDAEDPPMQMLESIKSHKLPDFSPNCSNERRKSGPADVEMSNFEDTCEILSRMQENEGFTIEKKSVSMESCQYIKTLSNTLVNDSNNDLASQAPGPSSPVDRNVSLLEQIQKSQEETDMQGAENGGNSNDREAGNSGSGNGLMQSFILVRTPLKRNMEVLEGFTLEKRPKICNKLGTLVDCSTSRVETSSFCKRVGKFSIGGVNNCRVSSDPNVLLEIVPQVEEETQTSRGNGAEFDRLTTRAQVISKESRAGSSVAVGGNDVYGKKDESSSSLHEIIPGFELERKIIKLERIFAELNFFYYGHPS